MLWNTGKCLWLRKGQGELEGTAAAWGEYIPLSFQPLPSSPLFMCLLKRARLGRFPSVWVSCSPCLCHTLAVIRSAESVLLMGVYKSLERRVWNQIKINKFQLASTDCEQSFRLSGTSFFPRHGKIWPALPFDWDSYPVAKEWLFLLRNVVSNPWLHWDNSNIQENYTVHWFLRKPLWRVEWMKATSVKNSLKSCLCNHLALQGVGNF